MSKTKTYFLFLLAALLPAMSQISSATEPDTIWTIGARGECWFTPDGTKILVKPNQCLNTSDGSVIWDYKDSVNRFSPNGYFSQDSLYFYDTDFDKYRISDGAKVATKPDFTFDTIPLSENLATGIYLLRIRINNELLFYNKINIIK